MEARRLERSGRFRGAMNAADQAKAETRGDVPADSRWVFERLMMEAAAPIKGGWERWKSGDRSRENAGNEEHQNERKCERIMILV